jgi:hypothetical protein
LKGSCTNHYTKRSLFIPLISLLKNKIILAKLGIEPKLTVHETVVQTATLSRWIFLFYMFKKLKPLDLLGKD